MTLSIRPLTDGDAEPYRALRLEALRLHPEAFGSAYEEQKDLPLESFARRLRDTAFFGAFDAADLVGSVGLDVQRSLKSSHIGSLIGVYLRKTHRGKGIARALVLTALEHAESRVLQVHLGVGTENLPAIGLYESLGFARYGTEPRSLCVNGRYIDEHMMVRFFDTAPERQTHD